MGFWGCVAQLDVDAVVHFGAENVYETMNVVMRRKPKENNFKAILECIRDLMNDDCVVPDWLHDIFLGYGDPGAAHYSKMPNQLKTITFKDTFVDKQHLLDSFPGQVGTSSPLPTLLSDDQATTLIRCV